MKKRTLTLNEIVNKVTKVLDRIIFENSVSLYLLEFKVRPGYGYDKFYLNHTDGSYDMSLQSLIHYILAEEGFYEQILNEDQFAKCMKVIKDEPEAIYSPSGDSVEDREILELLDAIYDKSITFTGRKLIAMGLDVYQDFEDYLNDSDNHRPEK
jgi:hypothetical protein